MRPASARVLDTPRGALRVIEFAEIGSAHQHLAIVHGHVAGQSGVPIYLRASGPEPPRADDLDGLSALFEGQPRGVLVWLRRDGAARSCDEREYVITADILRELRVRSVRLPSAEGAP